MWLWLSRRRGDTIPIGCDMWYETRVIIDCDMRHMSQWYWLITMTLKMTMVVTIQALGWPKWRKPHDMWPVIWDTCHNDLWHETCVTMKINCHDTFSKWLIIMSYCSGCHNYCACDFPEDKVTQAQWVSKWYLPCHTCHNGNHLWQCIDTMPWNSDLWKRLVIMTKNLTQYY